MDRKLLGGAAQVLAGAMSYGVLATIVRIAYDEGFSTAEVTFAQYTFGLVTLGAIYLINRKNTIKAIRHKSSSKQYWRLIMGGSALGLTGVFYYLSVRYLPVSLCVVILMQSIWMGVIIESAMTRRMPSVSKGLACLMVLLGTVFATGMLNEETNLHLIGLTWGFMAAFFMTISLIVCNQTALELPTATRSFFIILGSFVAVSVYGAPSLLSHFNPAIFSSWGVLLGFFGTVMPPLFYSAGMPKTGVGLGAILVSVEIPVSVSMATIVLKERVDTLQWIGIAMIIAAIVLLNYKLVFLSLRKEK